MDCRSKSPTLTSVAARQNNDLFLKSNAELHEELLDLTEKPLSSAQRFLRQRSQSREIAGPRELGSLAAVTQAPTPVRVAQGQAEQPDKASWARNNAMYGDQEELDEEVRGRSQSALPAHLRTTRPAPAQEPPRRNFAMFGDPEEFDVDVRGRSQSALPAHLRTTRPAPAEEPTQRNRLAMFGDPEELEMEMRGRSQSALPPHLRTTRPGGEANAENQSNTLQVDEVIFQKLWQQRRRFGTPTEAAVRAALLATDNHGGKARTMLEEQAAGGKPGTAPQHVSMTEPAKMLSPVSEDAIFTKLWGSRARFGDPPRIAVKAALARANNHGGKARGLLEGHFHSRKPWALFV